MNIDDFCEQFEWTRNIHQSSLKDVLGGRVIPQPSVEETYPETGLIMVNNMAIEIQGYIKRNGMSHYFSLGF